jgi:hypothetical protein
MKKIALTLIGFALLTACSSPKSDLDYKKELSTKIDEFKKADGEKLQSFVDQLESYKMIAKTDSYKPALNGGKLDLNYTKGTVFQMKMNYFHDTTSLGKSNRHFYDELDLMDLSGAITNPIDSFMPAYGDEGRSNQFDKLKERVMSQIKNQKYLVVLNEKKRQAPKWYGETFEQGTLDGAILVYELSSKKLVSIVQFNAISSTSVSAKDFGSLGDAAEADFSNQILSAYKAALKDNFNVTGEPSYVSDSR